MRGVAVIAADGEAERARQRHRDYCETPAGAEGAERLADLGAVGLQDPDHVPASRDRLVDGLQDELHEAEQVACCTARVTCAIMSRHKIVSKTAEKPPEASATSGPGSSER